MSMTENEAKSCIQGKLDCINKCDVFDCKNTDECDNCKFCYSQGNFGEQKKAFEMAIQALEEIQAYRAIGTIEEFKALKEKNEPKKPFDKGKFANLYVGLCSVCGEGVNSQMIYCDKCGFALDWQ
jgi:hypothetical protein